MPKLSAFRGLFFALFVTCLFAIGATFFARPLIIYNATDSLPHGLYLVVQKPDYERGDLVAFPVSESVKALVRQRRWLPDGAYLIKSIAGTNGDLLSTKTVRCFVNGRDFGAVETVDRTGQPLPVFSINRRLQNGEVAVLNPSSRSFDSRYFGPIKERQSSHPGEPPPGVLTDTDVNLSAHPAPPIQPTHTAMANGQTFECSVGLCSPTHALPGVGDLSTF
ncbi:putative conjugal transfer protein TraF [Prosthecochloris aestuarii DSM 271]|uniref:Conjugal transfer protein TraF n=1 Tax=Prosthecochloris aestuarii (strain DSM 271 / SK 413) TaxID=290512 RepID=B4S632_PROA2|nr:putative conjugal transfer protein TraF [Prosthecochloris aestuarii DSM 271]